MQTAAHPFLARSARFLIAFLVAASGGAFSPRALAQAGTVKLEWLTWSFFRFTSPGGKVIITNPFITGNPDAAAGIKLEEIGKPDLILVTDAHRDEVGDAVAIAKATGAKIVAPAFELGTLLVGWGVPEAQVMRRNPGGRFVGGGAARARGRLGPRGGGAGPGGRLKADLRRRGRRLRGDVRERLHGVFHG